MRRVSAMLGHLRFHSYECLTLWKQTSLAPSSTTHTRVQHKTRRKPCRIAGVMSSAGFNLFSIWKVELCSSRECHWVLEVKKAYGWMYIEGRNRYQIGDWWRHRSLHQDDDDTYRKLKKTTFVVIIKWLDYQSNISHEWIIQGLENQSLLCLVINLRTWWSLSPRAQLSNQSIPLKKLNSIWNPTSSADYVIFPLIM